MKKGSLDLVYIGFMTALYGLLIMGGVFAASSISTTSPIQSFNGIFTALSKSLNGISVLLVLFGAIFLFFGIYSKKNDS